MMTRAFGNSLRMDIMASMPLLSGSRTSIRVMSGRSSRNRSTASAPAGGLAHDAHVGLTIDKRGDSLPQQRMIIYGQDANTGLLAHWFPHSLGAEISFLGLAPNQRNSHLPKGLDVGGYERYLARHVQLHFRSSAWTAQNVQLGADLLRSLPHIRKAPVSFAAGLKHLRVNAAPVVAYGNSQPADAVLDFNFNAGGVRVAECVDDRLTGDAADFLANYWMQLSGACLPQ